MRGKPLGRAEDERDLRILELRFGGATWKEVAAAVGLNVFSVQKIAAAIGRELRESEAP